MNQRFKNVDFLKGVGMLLVIIGHCGIPSPYWNYIYSFHLPLFFFVSGAVFNSKKYSLATHDYISDLAKKYVKPYVIFSAIGLGITWLFPHIYGIEKSYHQLGMYFAGVVVGRGEMTWTGNWGAIWYLLATFWVLIMVYFVGKKSKEVLLVACCLGPVLNCWIVNKINWDFGYGWIIWNIGAALCALPIFGVGLLYRRFNLKINTIVLFLGGILLVFVGFSIAKRNPGIVAFANNGYGDIWLMYGGALLIPLGMAFISQFLYKYKVMKIFCWIEWIGQHTLLYLGIHGMTIPVVRYFIINLYNFDNWKITAPVVTIVDTIIIVVWEFLKKTIVNRKTRDRSI